MARRAWQGWQAMCVCALLAIAGRTIAAQATADVVLYATDAEAVHGNWQLVSDSAAAGGKALTSVDNGWSTTDAPLATPAAYVDFTFPADAGTRYRLWLRMRATGDSKWNDSVWVQFSDATNDAGAALYPLGTASGLLVNLEPCSNCGLSGWGWQDGAYWLSQSSTVRFARSGSHTLRVQLREDGVRIDQVVLSPQTYLNGAPGPVVNDSTIVAKPASASGTSTTISVPAGGNLQAALDQAQPGDTVLLQAGAVYTGTFTLGEKNGSDFITVRTAPSAQLPGEGGRIGPEHAPWLAKVRSGSSLPAFQTAPGAHHWRLALLELQANADGAGEIVRLGNGSAAQNSLSQVPYALELDRLYVHGDPAAGQKRGIALNSASTMITGCYIAGIESAAQESQAIAGWNGPGPYVIENNYLEAASENILFGGADPYIANLVPTDITIADNDITKPLSWRTQNIYVKNLLELKSARHVSVVRNVLEYSWRASQAGYAVLLTPRNPGACPWCEVDHVRFEQNIVRHAGAGFQILGYDDNRPSRQTYAIEIRDNLLYDIDPTTWGGNGYFLTITGGPRDLTIDHNTVVQENASGVVQLGGAAIPGFVYTNNVSRHGSYGFIGSGRGVGADSIGAYLPSALISRNVFAGGRSDLYPPDNLFPSLSQFDAQFVSVAADDYRLTASSAWRGAGTDLRDLGRAPSVPGTIEAEHFDEGGEGIAYHDTTPGNSGGAYWPSDVDLERASSGGYDVGWIAPGEWLSYSIDVATAGTYTLDARVAAPGPGGTFHVEADGRDVSGPMTIPATGGWQTWTTISKPVALAEGAQQLRIVFDAAGSCCVGNLDWIRFSNASQTQPPPAPRGITLPGSFEAVDYDAGGEGVGYHDTSAGNRGGAYRTDDVDIEPSRLGGYDVGWITDGEWLAFTVDVAAPGTYRLQLRVASPSASGRLHATLGSASTPIVSVPNTGGWQNWTTVSLTATGVAAGPQLLRLRFDTGGFNVADVAVTAAP
jgi:Carbohydrate binding module (family 6)